MAVRGTPRVANGRPRHDSCINSTLRSTRDFSDFRLKILVLKAFVSITCYSSFEFRVFSLTQTIVVLPVGVDTILLRFVYPILFYDIKEIHRVWVGYVWTRTTIWESDIFRPLSFLVYFKFVLLTTHGLTHCFFNIVVSLNIFNRNTANMIIVGDSMFTFLAFT